LLFWRFRGCAFRILSEKSFPSPTRHSFGTNLKPLGLRFFSISTIDLDYSNKMHPITVSEPMLPTIFYISLSDHRWKIPPWNSQSLLGFPILEDIIAIPGSAKKSN
jgi:hypothetical protein